MCDNFRHIFLFGSPGVGKTTLINKIYKKLRTDKILEKYPNLHIDGFTTSEIRSSSNGQRTGFKIETVDGQHDAILASENFTSSKIRHLPKVGKYFVDVENFERLAVDRALKIPDDEKVTCCLIIMDEIGKMECFSRLFCDQVRKLIDFQNIVILGTLPIDKPNLPPSINFVRNRDDVKLIEITRKNRDDMEDQVINLLMKTLDNLHSKT